MSPSSSPTPPSRPRLNVPFFSKGIYSHHHTSPDCGPRWPRRGAHPASSSPKAGGAPGPPLLPGLGAARAAAAAAGGAAARKPRSPLRAPSSWERGRRRRPARGGPRRHGRAAVRARLRGRGGGRGGRGARGAGAGGAASGVGGGGAGALRRWEAEAPGRRFPPRVTQQPPSSAMRAGGVAGAGAGGARLPSSGVWVLAAAPTRKREAGRWEGARGPGDSFSSACC